MLVISHGHCATLEWVSLSASYLDSIPPSFWRCAQSFVPVDMTMMSKLGPSWMCWLYLWIIVLAMISLSQVTFLHMQCFRGSN